MLVVCIEAHSDSSPEAKVVSAIAHRFCRRCHLLHPKFLIQFHRLVNLSSNSTFEHPSLALFTNTMLRHAWPMIYSCCVGTSSPSQFMFYDKPAQSRISNLISCVLHVIFHISHLKPLWMRFHSFPLLPSFPRIETLPESAVSPLVVLWHVQCRVPGDCTAHDAGGMRSAVGATGRAWDMRLWEGTGGKGRAVSRIR